jgi:hypothetical protein
MRRWRKNRRRILLIKSGDATSALTSLYPSFRAILVPSRIELAAPNHVNRNDKCPSATGIFTGAWCFQSASVWNRRNFSLAVPSNLIDYSWRSGGAARPLLFGFVLYNGS